MRKLLPLLAVLVLLLAAGGARAQSGVPPGGYNQNGAGTSIAALGAPGPWIRLDQFSPFAADLRTTSDAVTTNTTTITSASAAFTPSDGSGNKIAWVLNSSGGIICNAGIVTYVNSTTITISTTCTGGGGSSQRLYIGTNDYSAWVAACNAVPVTGGTIFIPHGPEAVLNTGAGTPFCTLSGQNGDVTLMGDSEELQGITLPTVAGTTIYPAAGYTYTNGGNGDFIQGGITSKIHLWNWGIDGGNANIAVSNQVLVFTNTIDAYNFMLQNFHNSTNNSIVIEWTGDNDNEIQNSYISATGFGAAACNGFNTSLLNDYFNGGTYGYEMLNGCTTGIVGGVFASTGTGVGIDVSGVSGLTLNKIAISGGTVICGPTALNIHMTGDGADVLLDSVVTNTTRCSQSNGTAIAIASGNRVKSTNSDISYTGTGSGVNCASGGSYTSSGGNYSSTATGVSLYITGTTCAWSLNQSDFPAPLTAGLSGFGTTPSVTLGGNVLAFSINVGTGGTAQTGTITFAPAAPNGWQINACWDITTQNATVSVTKQIGAGSTTQVTIGDFTDLGVAGAWASGDVLVCQAAPY